MASRFTALKLSSGEAFVLETEHDGRPVVILVDSGNSKRGSPHPLCGALADQTPEVSHIDIAVCTHKDADHSTGFATFADAWTRDGKSIGEFWLPGRWAINFPNLLLDQGTYLDDLVEGCFEAETSEGPYGWYDRLGEEDLSSAAIVQRVFELLDEESRPDDESRPIDEERAPDLYGQSDVEQCQAERVKRLAAALGTQVDRLKTYEPETGDQLGRLVRMSRTWAPHPWWKWGATNKLLDAIDTAEQIAAIADSAARNCIPIRWFDFDKFRTSNTALGGVKDLLIPVNSHELRVPPPRQDTSSYRIMLYLSLRLSVENVESLVFFRPETDAEPAVLFLGDSRLAFGVDRPEENFELENIEAPTCSLLVTAPHHGSRKNDRAYEVVTSWLGADVDVPSLYVRNGGQKNQSLASFLDQPDRACVHCWDCASRIANPRVVAVTTSNGVWDWSRQKHLCLKP